MTTILQITDTHIVPDGVLVAGKLDTADALEQLVARIARILPQIGPIDAVLISGDLSDDGSAASYARFKTLMAPLDVPLRVIPGNHDARETMRAAFLDHLPATGHLNWDERIGDIHMIGLDTLVEGHRHGLLEKASLDFLTDALTRAGTHPVLLGLHHPPFESGIQFMDAIGLENKQVFRDVVCKHSHNIHIVCGHIHCMVVGSISGHVVMSGPSPNSTFAYDRRADAPVGFMTQPDGCLLHRWVDGFQSTRIGPLAGEGPFPFN